MNKQEEVESILKKLYWQGRKDADIPITDISVRPEIEELMKLGIVLKVDNREQLYCPISATLTGNKQAIGCPYYRAPRVAVESLIKEPE